MIKVSVADKLILVVLVAGHGEFLFGRVQDGLNQLELQQLLIIVALNSILYLFKTPYDHDTQVTYHNRVLIA